MKRSLAVSLVLSLAAAVVLCSFVPAAFKAGADLDGNQRRDHWRRSGLCADHVAGIPIVMTYNWLSSVLRAVGDGKTPLMAMGIASIVNIVLDILFVAGFGLGIPGAAAATLIAQVCSCLFCARHIRKTPVLHFSRQDFQPDKALVSKLFKLGTPVALQNTIISIGGMILQSIVNSFGVIFVAGFTAANKLYGLLEIAAISFGFSVSTYTGQNLGAGEYKRIRIGVREAPLWLSSPPCDQRLYVPLRKYPGRPVRRWQQPGRRAGDYLWPPLPPRHGVLPLHPLWTAHLPFRPAGHGKHLHSPALRCSGTGDA